MEIARFVIRVFASIFAGGALALMLLAIAHAQFELAAVNGMLLAVNAAVWVAAGKIANNGGAA